MNPARKSPSTIIATLTYVLGNVDTLRCRKQEIPLHKAAIQDAIFWFREIGNEGELLSWFLRNKEVVKAAYLADKAAQK